MTRPTRTTYPGRQSVPISTGVSHMRVTRRAARHHAGPRPQQKISLSGTTRSDFTWRPSPTRHLTGIATAAIRAARWRGTTSPRRSGMHLLVKLVTACLMLHRLISHAGPRSQGGLQRLHHWPVTHLDMAVFAFVGGVLMAKTARQTSRSTFVRAAMMLAS